MATRKQIKANRRNAKRSSGPMTSRGKERVAQNALRHGLLSKETLMPYEDQGELEEVRQAMVAELRPEGALEEMLVERIVSNLWRLRRLLRIEGGVLAASAVAAMEIEARAKGELPVGWMAWNLEQGERSETSGGDMDGGEAEKAKARIEKDIQVMQSGGGGGDQGILGRAFVRDAASSNAIPKLSRYEAALERGIYRALHELERLQRARGGQHVPAPAVVDIDLHGLPER